MAWWKKLIDGIIRILSRIAFKCKSDCCSCQSECMSGQSSQAEQIETDHGTTWSAGQPKQEIMDYVHKID